MPASGRKTPTGLPRSSVKPRLRTIVSGSTTVLGIFLGQTCMPYGHLCRRLRCRGRAGGTWRSRARRRRRSSGLLNRRCFRRGIRGFLQLTGLYRQRRLRDRRLLGWDRRFLEDWNAGVCSISTAPTNDKLCTGRKTYPAPHSYSPSAKVVSAKESKPNGPGLANFMYWGAGTCDTSAPWREDWVGCRFAGP